MLHGVRFVESQRSAQLPGQLRSEQASKPRPALAALTGAWLMNKGLTLRAVLRLAVR